jgi:hypothetical protein
MFLLLELPADYARPAVQTFDGAEQSRTRRDALYDAPSGMASLPYRP